MYVLLLPSIREVVRQSFRPFQNLEIKIFKYLDQNYIFISLVLVNAKNYYNIFIFKSEKNK